VQHVLAVVPAYLLLLLLLLHTRTGTGRRCLSTYLDT
jgi:hypothetical protein